MRGVVSSSIIEDVIDLCKGNPSFAYAYFFFDGRNAQGQSHDTLLRSLISQLSHACKKTPSVLVDLYENCRSDHRQPSMADLQNTLQSIVGGFGRAYIIIGSLHECHFRGKLLPWLQDISRRMAGNLHLALTSRPEPDILYHLRTVHASEVCLTDHPENNDIVQYLDRELKTDTKLSRWPKDTRAHIKSVLMESAKGM